MSDWTATKKVSEFIENVARKVSVWSIEREGRNVGRVVATFQKSKSRDGGILGRMAIIIHSGLAHVPETLACYTETNGGGYDFVGQMMYNMMSEHPEDFEKVGIHIPTNEDDPVLNGQGTWCYLLNEWKRVFKQGGYDVVAVL